ncbi:MAG TPA: type II toxin-antitoxin system VapC family toxin [Bryobacteraceae bacterium]
MVMPDVNILVYAHREEARAHERYAHWLIEIASGPEPFALAEPVLQGFLRIVTTARIFDPPSTLREAFQFIDALVARPSCVVIRPGPEHWSIFRRLCEETDVRGKLVADAAHAALAIETGCEWITPDTDFARFAPLLRWRHL